MALGASRAVSAVVSFASHHRAVARTWLGVMVLLAVVVQVFVWGAPKTHGDGGSLLPQLRHIFGVGYAIILLAAELVFCAAYRLRRAAVWVPVAGACVDLTFWAAHLGGLHFPTGAAASLTAGAGAVVLTAGVLAGRFQPFESHQRRQSA